MIYKRTSIIPNTSEQITIFFKRKTWPVLGVFGVKFLSPLAVTRTMPA